MRQAIQTMFGKHPSDLGMSWAAHGKGAVVIGARMIGAGAACMVHAIVPAWFTETAGRTVIDLHSHMTKRRAGSANPDAWPDYEI